MALDALAAAADALRETARRAALLSPLPFSLVATAFVTAIFGAPLALLALVHDALDAGSVGSFAFTAVCPLAYLAGTVLVAGALSLPYQWAVRPGKFARDVTTPEYRARRLYGLCWTAVYYDKPAYFVCLSVPALKWLTFRLFGYRGQMDFTIYPDTWIRDLPLLDFGRGAYLSNRATIGTNIVLSNGTLLVDRVRFGQNALLGHLCMVGPGTTIEEGAELGVGSAVGARTRVGRNVHVGATSSVGHRVRLGDGARIGGRSMLAHGTVVAAGVELPDHTVTRGRERVGATRLSTAA